MILAAVISMGVSLVSAANPDCGTGNWTSAPSNPPNGNCDGPINTSTLAQEKLGALWVNTTKTNPSPVGVGFWVAAGESWFNGSLKIMDGTQGAGKVLTSDANGLATWQNAGGILVKRKYCSSSTVVSTNAPLAPGMNTTATPTQTSGELAFTCDYTPSATGNYLLIRVNGNGGTSSGSELYGLALFKDSDVLPLGTSFIFSVPKYLGGGTGTLTLVSEMQTSGTSPITFKLRFGGNSNGGSYYFNSFDGSSVYGGTVSSSMIIEEYTQH